MKLFGRLVVWVLERIAEELPPLPRGKIPCCSDCEAASLKAGR